MRDGLFSNQAYNKEHTVLDNVAAIHENVYVSAS